jgi:hypothetical protein
MMTRADQQAKYLVLCGASPLISDDIIHTIDCGGCIMRCVNVRREKDFRFSEPTISALGPLKELSKATIRLPEGCALKRGPPADDSIAGIDAKLLDRQIPIFLPAPAWKRMLGSASADQPGIILNFAVQLPGTPACIAEI